MPKLRFPEFRGELRTVLLGSLGYFYNGLSGKNKEDFGGGNSKYITYMNVYKNNIADITSCELVNVADNENQNKVIYGDLLFTQSSETPDEVGLTSVWIYNLQPYLNSFSFGFRFNELTNINPKHIAYYFRTNVIRKQIIKEGQGATRYNLSPSRLASLICVLPNKTEQDKIAKFLNKFCELIKRQEHLIELIKSYKRGLSIAIFDKKLLIINSTVKTVPLGSFCNITMGQSPDSSSYNTEGIGLPLVQGNADMKNGITVPTKYTSSPTKTCYAGNIILSVRAPVGSVGISNQKICIGRGVCSISSANNNYVLQYLKHCEKQWRTLEQGGTFTAISGDDIKTFPFILPNDKEVERIVKLLKGLDSLISCQETLLEKLMHCKQSMLQSLFI